MLICEQDPTSKYVKFTPDVWGTYRIRLTINQGQYSHVLLASAILDSAGLVLKRGWRLPSFKEIDTEANFPGQIRGYTSDLDTVLLDILDNAFSGGIGDFVAGGDLAGTPTEQTVIGLRARSLADEAPEDGQILTWRSAISAWSPEDLVVSWPEDAHPLIQQDPRTSDAHTHTMLFVGQAPYAFATGSNQNSGGFSFTVPPPEGTGTAGTFLVTVDEVDCLLVTDGLVTVKALAIANANLPTTGDVRVPQAFDLKSYTSAGDCSVVHVASYGDGTRSSMSFGDASRVYDLQNSAYAQVTFSVWAGQYFNLMSSGLWVNAPLIDFISSVAAPVIGQQDIDTHGVTAPTLTIKAASNTHDDRGR